MKFLSLTLLAAMAACGQVPPPATNDSIARMMAFDTNHDGKLTREEVTDERLLRLFDRADANHDGVVTKEELTALFAKETQTYGEGGRGGPGGGGGRGRGPGGGMGPREMGQILPSMMQDRLSLTDEQKVKIAELQKEVDGKLGKILTKDQNQQLQDMKRQGPPPPPR